VDYDCSSSLLVEDSSEVLEVRSRDFKVKAAKEFKICGLLCWDRDRAGDVPGIESVAEVGCIPNQKIHFLQV